MTQKSNHTPGPWVVGKTPRFGADEVTAAGRRVAQCSARGESTPETEANARLIASAPELLAFVESITDALGPYSYLNGKSIVEDAYRLAAKARGEAA